MRHKEKQEKRASPLSEFYKSRIDDRLITVDGVRLNRSYPSSKTKASETLVVLKKVPESGAFLMRKEDAEPPREEK